MRLYFKIKLAQLRLLSQKLHEKAKKLALAVVLMEYIIAGSWYIAEDRGWLVFLEPKTIIIYQAEAKETPKVEPKEDKTDRIDELMDLIFLRESTRGKNNYSKCEAQGKYNNIGYAIYDGKYICFDSHAEEMETLRKWIVKHINEGMSEDELLKHYSGGSYGINKG